MAPLTIRAKLRFYDMDRAGMVFHGAYARLFQDAFEELMEEAGFIEKDLEETLGVRVPVVQHEMRFPAPPASDELDVQVGLAKIGETSLRFRLVARDAEHDHEVATATVVRVVIDEDGDATPVPDPLEDALSSFRTEEASPS